MTSIVYVADTLGRRHPVLRTTLAKALAEVGGRIDEIQDTRDIWCRDYMPVPLGEGRFVQFVYKPDYLADEPELITPPEVAEQIVGTARRSELVVDGGNVVRRGRVAVVTDKVFAENPRLSRSQVMQQLSADLEIDRLVVIPVEPGDVCGHADGVLHLLDERTALVNDYSDVDPDYGARLGLALRDRGIESIPMSYAPDLKSRRRMPPATGVYVNLLEMAEAIFVPVYGIESDDDAVRVLAGVFGGRAVVPIDCRGIAREGGSLHCVTCTRT